MQVFLSYASADAALGRRLVDELEKAGINVWDQDNIYPGDNWAQARAEALESSDVMVVVFTRNSKGFPTLVQEVQFALISGNYCGRILPVLVNFETFQGGADVPWVLLKMDPIYLANESEDLRAIVSRVSTFAREAANAS